MSTIDYRRSVMKERQPRYRAEAEHAREAAAEAAPRPIRHRVGESIIRFGHRVAGDAVGDALLDSSVTA